MNIFEIIFFGLTIYLCYLFSKWFVAMLGPIGVVPGIIAGVGAVGLFLFVAPKLGRPRR